MPAAPRLHAELTHESRCVEVKPSLADPIAIDVVDGDHRQLYLLVRGRKAKLRANVFPLKGKLEHPDPVFRIRNHVLDLGARRREGILIEDLEQAFDLLLSLVVLSKRKDVIFGVVGEVGTDIVALAETRGHLTDARSRCRGWCLCHRFSSRLWMRLNANSPRANLIRLTRSAARRPA